MHTYNITVQSKLDQMQISLSWGHFAVLGHFLDNTLLRDLNKLQEGIGEKLGMLAFFTGTFILSIIVAFVYGWDLTLVIMSMIPFMIIFGGLAAKVQSTFAEKEMEAYGKAGVVAEEVLSAIRTVVAFGGETKEIER